MVDAQTISEALGGKRSGKGYLACCPAHEDRNPSLSIDDGDNGKPVVFCNAGCRQEAVIAALADLGLWPERDGKTLSRAELDSLRADGAKRKGEANMKRLVEQAQAATEARRRWDAAPPADPAHPYLAKKHIQPHGLRQEGDKLLVHLWDESGTTRALQTIGPDGVKMFFPARCRTKGLYFSIGQPAPGGPVCIVEGFATGAAIHEATGHPVACAMTAGNLEAVARTIKAKLPGHQIVVCADDDRKPDTEKNPGLEAATKAALAVGGVLAVPAMGKKGDFWDLFNECGADAVRAAIVAAQPVADQGGGEGDAPASNQETETPAPADPVATIQQLAGLSAVEYELKRKAAAEALGIRASALDRAVKEAKKGKDENDLPFDEPDPWPVPVDPDQLLTDIASAIQRFIVCSKEVAHTVALWAAMSWFMGVVQVAPLAVITAPEKRCGKSQLLFLLGRLSARSITASSISPAALYRAIEKWSPTLLIDEVDACLKDNDELRGIINAGHTRDSAFTIRCVGDDHEPKRFNLWGAKALAGIGHVADTLMDRAVILELRRKLPHESVDRLRYAEPDLFHNLRAKLARFAEDYSEQVRQARPLLPASLNDRAQDNWEPLLAIAMVAGGHWLEIGTKAALKLSGAESAAQSIGVELLIDIQEIFEAKDTDRISTADLIKALCEDDEKVWSTYNRGNPIKPRQLANKLKGFGITSGNIRIGNAIPKGFKLEQFNEAFSRYIPQAPPEKSATPLQSHNFGILNPLLQTLQNTPDPLHATPPESKNVADYPPRSGCVADDEQRNLLFNRTCSGVADRIPSSGDSKVEVEI